MKRARYFGHRERAGDMGRELRPDATQIAEAAAWRLVGLLLERPRAGWQDEVAALGREVRDKKLRAAAEYAARVATEGEYLWLLGPGGAVSPREVSYRPFDDPGHVLAELSAFYEAFAFRPRVEEPIDHIGVEAGFAGYLLLKQAFADVGGQRQAGLMIAAARDRFLATHLAPIAGPFACGLKAAGVSYLVEPAVFIAERVPSPRPATVPGPLIGSPGDCGSCHGG